MLTLLSECHFWTCRDDKIRIKDYDLGAFKYYTNVKRDFDGKDLIALGKKEYNEQRDGIVILQNDKTIRLKDNIKKFEELIKMHSIVKINWKNGCVVQMLLDNGIIVHICVNLLTGDILRIAFDKFFVGKLASEVVIDAIFSRQNILISYNTNQITVVHLQKPTMRRASPEKISNMDPKIYHIIIPGSADKKLPRNLVVNRSFDLVIVWTKSSQNELFPWKPTYQDQDRANMHVFKLREDRLEAIGFCWTENEPLCTQFLKNDENKIITVEQKVSRKGEISADICIYGILKGRLQKTSSHAIPIGSQITSYRFSPDQERLFLGTVENCVCIYDISRQKTKFLPKTEIAPIYSSWHSDSTVVLIGDDEAKLQFYDYALNPLSNQLMSEELKPSNILDISVYFLEKPKLVCASFSSKINNRKLDMKFAIPSDFFLLLIFEHGPIACLRFFGNEIDMDTGLTADTLISRYLIQNQFDRAVNLLLCSNWETNSSMCMLALNKICNYVITRDDVKRSRNDLLKKALKSFSDELNNDVKDEYSDQVIDLRRRFFFFLLRHSLFTECLEIARLVLDYDLFMDLFNCTKADPNLISITHEAYHQAEEIVNQGDKESSSSRTSDDSEKNNSEEDTTSTSSFPSYPDYAEDKNEKMKTTIKDSHRRRSLNLGKNTCSSYDQNKYQSMPSTSKDNYYKNHVQQQLKVKRYHKNFDETDFILKNSRNYVPPLQSYKSPVNKASSIKIKKPFPLQIPDSPNVSNGCFRLLKKPKDSSSKYLNKSNTIRDEVDLMSSTAIATNRSLKNMNNLHLSEQISSKFRKKSLEFYTSTSNSKTKSSEEVLGIPVTVSQIKPQLNFHPSVSQNTQHPFIPRPSTNNRSSMSPERLPMRVNDIHQAQKLPLSSSKYTGNDSVGSPKILNPSEVCTDPSAAYGLKYFQHPLTLGHIPFPNLCETQNGNDFVNNCKKPSASILSSSSNGSGGLSSSLLMGNNRFEAKRDLAIEKNKVKFSDTVQVAVVPERKDKPIPMKRNGYLLSQSISKVTTSFLMDPEKELAESLPLCNPREEYLKDFNRTLANYNLDNNNGSKLIDEESFITSYIESCYLENFSSDIEDNNNRNLKINNSSSRNNLLNGNNILSNSSNSLNNTNNISNIDFNSINIDNNNSNINNFTHKNNNNCNDVINNYSDVNQSLNVVKERGSNLNKNNKSNNNNNNNNNKKNNGSNNQNDESNTNNGSSIKVVHFGIV